MGGVARRCVGGWGGDVWAGGVEMCGWRCVGGWGGGGDVWVLPHPQLS